MELESKSLVALAPKQGVNSIELNTLDGVNILGNSQSGIEGAVIIYDTETQQQQVVKVVTETESKSEVPKESIQEELNNLITFHAPNSNVKNEVPANNSNKNKNDSKNTPSLKNQETEELDDDETIATFVTSTGQQLALYAVEDSDDIFAVALYDESGIPPTDFHILLKADVERLIGEGAVKTVKKPPVPQNKDYKPPQKKEQIKFEKIHEIKSMPERVQEAALQQIRQKTEIIEVPKNQKSQKPPIVKTQQVKLITTKTNSTANSTVNKTITPAKPVTPQITKKTTIHIRQSEVSNKKETNIAYTVVNQKTSSNIVCMQDDLDSDTEIIEQSTVQNILCDGDISDSELTFDDVKASLQNFKMRQSTISTNKTKPLEPKKIENKKEANTKVSPISKNISKVAPILSQKKTTLPTIHRTYKSPKKSRLTNNLLQAQKKIKKEVIDPSYGDGFDDEHISSDEIMKNMSESNSSIIGNSSVVKVKRSRKQQLTVVNRADSEIIIQPASAFSEDEIEPVIIKRRGRKKKKILADPDYTPRNSATKNRRSNRSVEVIDIDIDDNEKSSVMDGRIGGSKEKGSSDKENDVISIDDSEEDDKGTKKKKLSKPMMQCSHCMRNFRKRNALEKHLTICSKSSLDVQKIEQKKICLPSAKKKFKCKSCDETFDIAVALARHVRVVHSPRKRGRPTKNSWIRDDRSETTESEDSTEESSPEPEPGPRKRGRPPGKKNLLKTESPIPDIELKLDSSPELLSEVRKRGRPPLRKNLPKERSSTPDLTEKSIRTAQPISEPRKRGRPRKASPVKEDRSISPTTNEKAEKAPETSTQVPRKRGRPSKKSLLKEDNSAPDAEEKNKNSVETPVEPRKRGRPSKRSILKNDRSASPEVVIKTEIVESKLTNRSKSPKPEKKENLIGSVVAPPKKRKFSKEENTKEESVVTAKLDDKSENLEGDRTVPEEMELIEEKSQEKSVNEIGNLESSLVEVVTADKKAPKIIQNDKDDKIETELEKRTETDSIDSTSEIPEIGESIKDKDIDITDTETNIISCDQSLIESQKNCHLNRDKVPKTLKVQDSVDILKESSVETQKNVELNKENPLMDPTFENSGLKIKLESLEEDTTAPEEEEQISKDGDQIDVQKISEIEKQIENEKMLVNSPDKEISDLAGSSKTKELEDQKMESKIESLEELVIQPLNQDKSSNIDKIGSVSSDLKTKNEKSNEPVVEQRKRGRPSKDESVKSKPAVEVNKTLHDNKPRAFVRKRGRPSKDESSKNELLLTLELESRVDTVPQPLTESHSKSKCIKDEPSKDNNLVILEQENKIDSAGEPLATPRKRGRPSKTELSKDQLLLNLELETKVENVEDSTEESRKKSKLIKDESMDNEKLRNLELDLKTESSEEFQPKVRKRGRPTKDKSVKDDKGTCPEQNIKVDNAEESSIETRKKGRQCKDKSCKEDKLEEEQITIDTSTDSSSESRKKGKQDKNTLAEKVESIIEIKDEIKEEISTDSPLELRKRGRPAKGKTLKFNKLITSEVENKNTKVSKCAVVDRKDKASIIKKFPGSKLKCTDCGKWFPSATSLSTHHLQHRTKKSGQQVQHCSTCKMLIPTAKFSKHLTTVHGKSSKLLKVKTIGSLALRRKRLIPVQQVAKIAKITRKSQSSTPRASH